MNGRYLLDTNAVIDLLQGNESLLNCLENATWVAISIITYLEFLSFSDLSEGDRSLFLELIDRIEIIDLQSSNQQLIDQILRFRTQHRLKLPDAIIVATATHNRASLITADVQLLKIPNLNCITF